MKYLIWDFDGTLGYRHGGMWSATLLEILHQEKPKLDVTMERIRPYLQTGFPWHNPRQPHPDIKSSDQWWQALDGIFEQAFIGVGISLTEASVLAKQVRYVYPQPTSWRLFEEVASTLEQLAATGWKHLILSNHVPELEQIIRYLKLDTYITRIFNSAETGYEKPHPHAFLSLLATLDDIETIWMIGDSMESDIAGAEAVGLPGILVRRFDPKAKYYCETVAHLSEIIVKRA